MRRIGGVRVYGNPFGCEIECDSVHAVFLPIHTIPLMNQKRPHIARADPTEICHALLQRTRLGPFGGDIESWVNAFRLPYKIETFRGVQILKTVQELENLYTKLSTQVDSQGISAMVRRVIVAEFRTPALIETTYETRLLQGHVLAHCYISRGHICCFDGDWQITDAQHAFLDEAPHAKVMDKLD